MGGSRLRLAVDHLKSHPELHTLPSRNLEKVVKEVHVSYHTWGRAKRELGIPPLPRFNNVVRTFHPRKQVKGTTTIALDALNGKVSVKTTEGKDEVYHVSGLTMDFLAWVLEKRRFTYRSTLYGAVFSRTERV